MVKLKTIEKNTQKSDKLSLKLFLLFWTVVLWILIGYIYYINTAQSTLTWAVSETPKLQPVGPISQWDKYRIRSSSRFTVVMYDSLDCPSCRTANATINAIEKELDGRISIIVREFPISGVSSLVKEKMLIDQCVYEKNSKEYWEFFKKARQEYPRFHLSSDWIKKIALTYVPNDELSQCMRDEKTVRKIEQVILEGKNSLIMWTPTLVIFDGEKQVARYNNIVPYIWNILKYLASFEWNSDFFWSESIFQSLTGS